MSAFDPKQQPADTAPEHEAADTEPLFPPELRAALRRDLGPAPADRARVRHALLSSVAAGTLTPAAQRVDALLHGHAASAAGGKTAVTATVHALTTKAVTKLVVVGVVIAGGTSAVVMRGPSAHERPAVHAPAGTHKPSPASQVPAHAGEPPSARAPEQAPAGADEQQTTALADGTSPQPANGASAQPAPPLRAATPGLRAEPKLEMRAQPPSTSDAQLSKRGQGSMAARGEATPSAAAARSTPESTRAIPTPGAYKEPASRTAAVSSTSDAAQTAQLAAAAAASRSSATDQQPTAASGTTAAAAITSTAPNPTPLASTPMAANSGTAHASATGIDSADSAADRAQPETPESTSAGDAPQPSAAGPLPSRVGPSVPQPELAAELALVRAASAALQRGDAQQALAQLERHSARFPQGALRVEAQALRAIALCSTGAANAAAASGRFIELHAGSPLAERVQRACSQGSQR